MDTCPPDSGPDRRAIIEDLVVARSMAVAMLPADDREPGPASPLWGVGLGRVIGHALRTSTVADRRDAVVLIGAHVIGWIEAIDEELAETA